MTDKALYEQAVSVLFCWCEQFLVQGESAAKTVRVHDVSFTSDADSGRDRPGLIRPFSVLKEDNASIEMEDYSSSISSSPSRGEPRWDLTNGRSSRSSSTTSSSPFDDDDGKMANAPRNRRRSSVRVMMRNGAAAHQATPTHSGATVCISPTRYAFKNLMFRVRIHPRDDPEQVMKNLVTQSFVNTNKPSNSSGSTLSDNTPRSNACSVDIEPESTAVFRFEPSPTGATAATAQQHHGKFLDRPDSRSPPSPGRPAKSPRRELTTRIAQTAWLQKVPHIPFCVLLSERGDGQSLIQLTKSMSSPEEYVPSLKSMEQTLTDMGLTKFELNLMIRPLPYHEVKEEKSLFRLAQSGSSARAMCLAGLHSLFNIRGKSLPSSVSPGRIRNSSPHIDNSAELADVGDAAELEKELEAIGHLRQQSHEQLSRMQYCDEIALVNSERLMDEYASVMYGTSQDESVVREQSEFLRTLDMSSASSTRVERFILFSTASIALATIAVYYPKEQDCCFVFDLAMRNDVSDEETITIRLTSYCMQRAYERGYQLAALASTSSSIDLYSDVMGYNTVGRVHYFVSFGTDNVVDGRSPASPERT